MGDKTEKPITIDKWDGSALKNALDDAAKKVMKETFGMTESYRLMDGRLFLCTLSVAFALLAVVWDWYYPYPKSRDVMIACVILYFVVSVIITVYLTFIEKNIFYVGMEKDKAGLDRDNKWVISSKLKKYDDNYTIEIALTDGETQKTHTSEMTRSVAAFFDEKGNLCQDIYDQEIIAIKESLHKKSQ